MGEDLIDERLLRLGWRSGSGAARRTYPTSYPSVDSLATESEYEREGSVNYATRAASGEVLKGRTRVTGTETCVILTATTATSRQRWCDSELKERLRVCVWYQACVKEAARPSAVRSALAKG